MQGAPIRIAVRARARLLSILKAALALLVLVALVGVATESSERLQADPADGPREIATLIVAALGGLASFLVFVSAGAATLAKKPWLEVTPEHLTIHHRGLFRRDVTVPRLRVAAVSIDDRSARLERFRDHPRFELAGAGDGREPRWLFSKAGGAPFPLLSQSVDVPNLAICFTEPLRLGPARRWIKVFPARSSIHPPIHNRRSRGLLLRVADPGAARAAFEPWGVVRDITISDLSLIRPTEADRRKVVLLGRLDGAAIIALLGALLVLPVVVQDDARGSFLIPARGVCNQLDDVRIPQEPVSLPDVAIMESLLPDDPGDNGYFTLDGTSFSISDNDGHEFASVLDDATVENSYFKRWGRPNFSLYAEVYQVPEPSEASALLAALVGRACVDASETFSVSGVPGSVGMRWPSEQGIVDMTFFARDTYVFWIAVIETGTIEGTAELAGVARDIDDGLDDLSP